MRLQAFSFNLFALTLCLIQLPASAAPDGDSATSGGFGAAKLPGNAISANSDASPIRLQGSAEVHEQANTNLLAWQAAQMYRQGGTALSMQNFQLAADCFKQAGDNFERAQGRGPFTAQARFAEAQARRLLRQNARAAKLFAEAAEMFRESDPRSPYLQAAVKYRDELGGSKPLKAKITDNKIEMHPLPPMIDTVDRNVVLKGAAEKSEDGTLVASLKDGDFFSGGKRLPSAAPANVSDGYVHNSVYKAFLKMTCLEFTALGGNFYTAPDMYHSFKSNGQTVVIGASDEIWSPVIKITLNGKPYGISMDLPEMSRHSKNVLLVTDGQHIVAIDPRTNDTWKLVPTIGKKTSDFTWWKLTHTKKGCPKTISQK
jgi:hypothetical protein